MDNRDNLTLADTGIPGGGTVDKLASTVKNLAAGVRNKAKAKAAQKTADAGQYWTLRPFLKSLIPIPQYIITQVAGQGISENAILQLPEQGVGSSNTQIIAALKQMSGSGNSTNINPTGNEILNEPDENSELNIKKYLPYIIGIAILGLIIYFATKK